ncbi:hypothetical protein COW46_01035 [Candidatus Gracilibacteria bacterium CG17_big_fil_post_rev_8_21_14_2_50_48_13]|nr:MAG: hypothetical protein COW46_01035 [Candidatus Gracilibacteria bacterium CG17_big_fil_post_rev_8_21_14_2_50_48_13]
MSADRDYIVENLAMLVDSGMDIMSSLKALHMEANTRALKKRLGTIIEMVEGGSPLWKAFEQVKLLSTANIALIHIGEESAHLARNLSLIAAQHQKARGYASKIRSALLYPVLILSLTLIIGIGISWFILPKLAKVFLDLKIELPLMTKILLGVGEVLEQYGLFLVPAIIGGIVLFMYIFFVFKKTRFIGQWVLMRTPVLKEVIQDIEVARFGQVLGTLLQSGLPIAAAMDSIIEATNFDAYKSMYTQLRDLIVEGDSFRSSFERIKNSRLYIPLFIQQILAAGEKSGNLSPALKKIGDIYEEKTDEMTRNLTVLLEPIMLFIIWLGVIGAAMAVVMPIYNLIGNLNN